MHAIKERLWVPLEILDVTAFMRPRIILWERAVRSCFRMTDIRNGLKFSEKREQTEVSFSEDR